MTTDENIRSQKLNYDIDREAAYRHNISVKNVIRISPLSSSKIDICKYFTGEEILPSNQNQKVQ